MAQVIRRHPHWPMVFMGFCSNYESTYDFDPLLSKLISDRSRYLIAFYLFALCYENERTQTDGGRIYSKVRDFASRYKLASPNRASGIVKRLAAAGYVSEAKSKEDARNVNVTITDRGRALIAMAAGNFYRAISAFGEFDYVGFAGSNKLFAGLSIKHYIDIFTQEYDPAPIDRYLGVFLLKDAGFPILLKAAATQGRFSENGNKIINFTFSAMAAKFNVSNGHIRRMFQEAEKLGLVRLHTATGAEIEILPLLATTLAEYMSIVLAIAKEAADRSIEDAKTLA